MYAYPDFIIMSYPEIMFFFSGKIFLPGNYFTKLKVPALDGLHHTCVSGKRVNLSLWKILVSRNSLLFCFYIFLSLHTIKFFLKVVIVRTFPYIYLFLSMYINNNK